MKEGFKDRFFRAFTVSLALAILVGGTVMLWPNYMRSRSLREKDAKLNEEIAAMRRKIAELRDNQTRFKTDREFVEMIARQNRRVFPGEIVFIFDEKK
ncbi:MAG: septum formation initiator family protein [Kiritimatiellae bacterium]|nr:septum formation initiator family protein [Kiritimatiellia bacterium]